MKKIFVLYLSLVVLCLSLAGCSGNSTKITDNEINSNPVTQEPQSSGRDNADTPVAEVADKEATQKIPHEVGFDGGFTGPVICGPYDLTTDNEYYLTVGWNGWNEGGELKLEVIERINAADATITEYIIKSGEALLLTVSNNGVYRIRIPQGNGMSNIQYELSMAAENMNIS